MDINCTHNCFYQYDGKCTLSVLPPQGSAQAASSEIDCPYYATTSNT